MLRYLIYFTLFLSFANTSFAQTQIGQDIDGQNAGGLLGVPSCMPNAQTLAVGAPFASNGLAQVFIWYGGMWVQKGGDFEGNSSDYLFGGNLDMPDANTIAISGTYDSGPFDNYSFVRIYDWIGNTWVQRGTDIIGEAPFDAAKKMSMSDPNTIAVGAWLSDENGNNSGQVRVYRWNGNSWTQKGLDFEGSASYHQLGFSVSLPDSNTLAFGVPGVNFSAGAARVFNWNGSNWVQKGGDILGEASNDNSGQSIDMVDTNTIAIGAALNDGNGNISGHVRVYTWNGVTWVQKGVDIDGEAAGDYSGTDVSMPTPDVIAIGAWANQGNGIESGHARVFSWDGLVWNQVGFDIDGEGTGDQAGRAVCMPDEYTLAIGAYYNDDAGTDAGHARVFKLRGVWGTIYNDLNSNCILDSEVGLAGRMATIQPGNIIVQTNSLGRWYIDSLPAGSYTITVDTSGSWYPTCSPVQSFDVIDPLGITDAPSIGFLSSSPCPSPDMSINMPFIRRGFSEQKVYVQACNEYTASGAIVNASILVDLDSLIFVDSASINYISLGNNIYQFDVGTINPGECINFSIWTTVDLAAEFDQTLCLSANLITINGCVLDTIPAIPPPDFVPCSLPWDQSSISVDGWCQNDTIYFTIENTGNFGSGDMDCFSPVRLYIDGTPIFLDSIQLLGGEIDTLIFAGDGRTWRLEVDQHPLHPGNSQPNASIERCGNPNNWTPDLLNIFPHDDADPIVDIYCGIVTGSYDPNDKTGFPFGVTDSNFVAPNLEMEYLVRFQNTGNDTAFTVIIRDTLDTDFDIFSLQPGVASHDFTFQMYGPRIMEWTFNNILLPDSTTDEPGSNGFLTYTVNQLFELPDDTELNNTAYIYFDFNAPIITNTTSHIIRRNYGVPTWTVQDSIVDTACIEYLYDNIAYTQSGTFWNISPNISPDTLTVLSLEIGTVDTSIIISPNILTSNAIGASSYEWMTCDSTYNTIPGSIQASYQPSVDGYYALAVSENGCTDTSECFFYSPCQNTGIILDTIVCDSFLADWGQVLTSSGTYYDTLVNAGGCDSLVTLNLFVNSSNTGVDVISACDSYIWIDGNTYTTSNSTATHTLTNILGCDSLVTLDLTINHSSTAIDTVSACESFTWIDGNTYTASNNSATHTLTNDAGCDSVVTLNLNIVHSSTAIDLITTCDSLTWIDGITYTSSNNTATHVLMNASGCDSVVTLDLTLNYSDFGFESVMACDSFIWIDGNTYTTSNNTASTIIPSSIGCDSTVSLNLTIYHSTVGNQIDTTVCDQFIAPSGNHIWYTDGLYYDTLQTINGCDSIIPIDLTVESIDLTVQNVSNTFTANETGALYQWIDCSDSTIIVGETSQSFTPSTAGEYAIIIEHGVCMDTSACYLSTLSIPHIESGTISVLPNPTDGNFVVDFGRKYDEAHIHVRNSIGQIVSEEVHHSIEKIECKLLGKSGVYFVNIETEKGKWVFPLVKL